MSSEETTKTGAQPEKKAGGSTMQPISHECAFLEDYFYSIVQFQFDRAHECASKERTSPMDSKAPLWNGLLNSLITFANAEKGYFAMAFFEKRIFNRTLKPTYYSLSTEYMTLITSTTNPRKTEAFVYELCKQLNQFVQARLKMIDFYEYFMKCKWSNVRNTKEIIVAIQEVGELFLKSFHHPVLDSLKTAFNYETEIITSLLTAEHKLCEWEFLESLLTLRDCKTKLHAWRILSPPVSVKDQQDATFKYSFFTSKQSKKQSETPTLYQWLQLFYCHLLSKFSFYFYTTLSSQAASPDLKGSLSKNTIDYISKVTNFQRKTDAHSVSLVLDASSKESVYKGHGYFLENTLVDIPTGINSYPSVVSIPENIPKEHWPNIISMLTDSRMSELNSSSSSVTSSSSTVVSAAVEKVCYLYDTRMESTYFWIKVDVRMFLVLVYRMKKKEKDSYINNFLTEIRANLGHEKLFQMLKPNQSKLF